jgi:ABC-2 type transport system permease protein
MGKLFGSSIKMLLRDKQALFWALAFPIIFAVVFGLFDFNQAPTVTIAVTGDRTSPAYAPLVSGLKQVETFDVQERSNEEAALTDLKDGDVDVVVSVPSATAPPVTLEVSYSESNFSTNQFALTTIQQIVDQMNMQVAGVTQPVLTMEAQPVQAKTVRYYDFLLPGLVAMGVMTFSISGMAIAIARFREQRILKRILATPLRPVRFLSAQVLARLVLALAQAALILAVGVFLFNGHIYGDVIWIFVLAAIANLIFLNLGFAVAGRASNPDAAAGLAQAIALPMMFLSGTFFPTDTLPTIVQKVVQFLPLTPLIEAMRIVAVDGKPITAAGTQLVLLGGWVLVSFALAARLFRFSEAR